jgi:hypothetical protein
MFDDIFVCGSITGFSHTFCHMAKQVSIRHQMFVDSRRKVKKTNEIVTNSL